MLIGLVGDVFVDRDPAVDAFSDVLDALAAPDVLFGNLEGAYADSPPSVSTGLFPVVAPTRNLEAFPAVGFDVLSLANNHAMDAGYEALLDTRARLNSRGVLTCGAGPSLAAAHSPAVAEVDGLRVAFLAYASFFPMRYQAAPGRPGIAVVRASNAWHEPWGNIHAPGLRPYQMTVPNDEDLSHLADDLEKARAEADLVITSFHWGDHTRAFHLTDHEIRTAHFCIDHGAAMVVGHHHHSLRGIEWYRAKPIFYGLGHFIFDSRLEWSEVVERSFWTSDIGRYLKQVGYRGGPRKGWPLLPFPEESRLTMLAWARAERESILDVGFLPCALTPDGKVHPLELDSADGRQVLSYVEECSATQGLNAKLTRESPIELAGCATVRVLDRDKADGVAR